METKNSERNIGTMLPCNVIAQGTEDKQIEVSAINPIALMQTIENPKLAEIVDQVQAKLKKIVEKLDIKNKEIKRLINVYKAFFQKVEDEHKGANLALEQRNAVALSVLNEIMNTAFDNQKISEKDRAFFKLEFEKLLREECPDMVFQTPLKI